MSLWGIVFALLSALAPLRAQSNVGESAGFAFDTREYLAGLAAESAGFSFDTRVVDGLMASASSGTFAFDTRIAALTGLLVTGPGQIARGQAAQYHAFALYADSHQEEVTSLAQWKITGDLGATPALANVAGGWVTLDARFANSTPLCICASYQTFTGRRAANQNVLVLQDIAVSATATVESSNLPGIYLVHLHAIASGGTGAVAYSWDRDGNGVFGDAVGADVEWVYASTGGTVFPRVRATDAAGLQREALTRFTIDKVPSLNQPGKLAPASSKGSGVFLDKDGSSTQPFVEARVNNGLVVIAHGIYSSGRESWVKEMANLIETRIPANLRPNIICYDWEGDAIPSGAQASDSIAARRLHFMTSDTRLSLAFAPVNFVEDILGVRPVALRHGRDLGDRLMQEAAAIPPRVNLAAPVHFIGHSAGGFVVGEAAQYLRQQGKVVDRVTMLDTPVPERAHLTELIATEPGLSVPTYVERIISSMFGTPQFPNTSLLLDNDHRQTIGVWPGPIPLTDHFLAHRWYRYTIPPAAGEDDWGGSYALSGFYLSPFANGPHAGRIPPLVPLLAGGSGLKMGAPLAVGLQSFLGGFSTFGSVVENAGTYTITELADAGIFKNMTVPPGAVALRFKYRFSGTGDGDFLGVRFGARPEMFYADDLPGARSAFQQAEVQVGEYAQLADSLVFTLVSRGTAGSVLEIKDIEITEDDDADADGLTTAQELAAGTDPQARDTDLDGIDDATELNVTHTNPLLADSDGDGQPDAAEIAAGTNPVDSHSVFAVTEFARAGGGFLLRWSAVAGKTYRIVRSGTVDFASFDVIASGLAGVAPVTTFNDTTINTVTTAQAFYRIEAE